MFFTNKKSEKPERMTTREFTRRLDALIVEARQAGLWPSDIATALDRKVEAIRERIATTSAVDARL
jgi:hypothetical protein